MEQHDVVGILAGESVAAPDEAPPPALSPTSERLETVRSGVVGSRPMSRQHRSGGSRVAQRVTAVGDVDGVGRGVGPHARIGLGHHEAVTGKGRDRRAAKQRRRDERRGFRAGAGTGSDSGADRGLPPETLRRVLRETADDLAAGDDEALGELRLLLSEHLARRRREILSACDEVLGEAGARGEGTRAWAEREGRSTEEAVVATVRRLAGLT